MYDPDFMATRLTFLWTTFVLFLDSDSINAPLNVYKEKNLPPLLKNYHLGN